MRNHTTDGGGGVTPVHRPSASAKQPPPATESNGGSGRGGSGSGAASPRTIDPSLTESDLLVLHNLLRDERLNNPHTAPVAAAEAEYDDATTAARLAALQREPVVLCTWDYKALPLGPGLVGGVLRAYIAWAQTIVRHPVDVIFLNHIFLYLGTSLPSAVILFRRFSWVHGVLHFVLQAYYSGSFTLMLHNCIHQNGLLARRYAWADRIWPYVLEPLMGHTWDSYFYHHVKHHHVENNGPDDLSSTLRYQRDDLLHFLMYVGRFLAFVWLELPLYFFRKRKTTLGVKAALSELSSYAFLYVMTRYNWRASLFAFILPFCMMRIGLMVGNFGQHALVDEIDPDSDFRSSITLIDVPSNRFCFNDGYHTSHHLNPRRHWKDHQAAFIKAKKQYQDGHALVFHNIDYLMMTYRLLRKQYLHLADCMIPIGSQVLLTREERAELLRSKTRRFTEAEIQAKYYAQKSS